jgi:nicotinamidase-related amidase
MGTTLVIVDPQHDFIDDTAIMQPALPVPGAAADMGNLIDLIDYQGSKIDRIVIPLDQHPVNHIAHGVMWLDPSGNHPTPFTVITDAEIKAGRWRASLRENEAVQHAYVEAVEATGEELRIWPPHCIIGSIGATIYEPLWDALGRWWVPGRELLLFPKSGVWCSEQYS